MNTQSSITQRFLPLGLLIGLACLPIACGSQASGGGSSQSASDDATWQDETTDEPADTDDAEGDGSAQDDSAEGSADSAGGTSDDSSDDSSDESSSEDTSSSNDNSSSDIDRPEGWTEESHSNDVDANYDIVFPEGEVKRLDITVAPEDWQAMQDDMADMLGEFGQGGGEPAEPPPAEQKAVPQITATAQADPPAGQQQPPPALPPEAFAACEGLEDGDECRPDVTAPMGVCRRLEDGRLACVREDAPPGGDAGGEPAGGGTFGLLPRDPIYVPCTLVFEEQTWWHVGIRFKGNSTLKSAWQSGIGKMPFRLDFDEFEDDYPEIDDQRFYGFKHLTLANNSHDPSMLRQKVAFDIFREAGVPSPRTAFYRLYLDFGDGPVYFGLYTMTEVPADPMLETQFSDDDGNLYKPEGSGATWTAFDEESFPKQTNEDEEDWSDVQAAIDALHGDRSDAEQWRAGLEATFNVDGFLLWLAVNTVIQNWDSYGNTPQNYYLYSDPDDDWRLHWIPWDLNEALKPGNGPDNQALSLGFDEVDDHWPLIRYLMDDPVYRATYVSHVREVIDGAFAVEPTQERLQAAHDLIEPYVVGADGEQAGYTFLAGTEAFDTELDSILDHVANRREAALDFLEAN